MAGEIWVSRSGCLNESRFSEDALWLQWGADRRASCTDQRILHSQSRWVRLISDYCDNTGRVLHTKKGERGGRIFLGVCCFLSLLFAVLRVPAGLQSRGELMQSPRSVCQLVGDLFWNSANAIWCFSVAVRFWVFILYVKVLLHCSLQSEPVSNIKNLIYLQESHKIFAKTAWLTHF